MSRSSSNWFSRRMAGAFAVVLLGSVLSATFFQTTLSSRLLATNFISPTTWTEFVKPFLPQSGALLSQDVVAIPFSPILFATVGWAVSWWILGAFWLAFFRQYSITDAFIIWGWSGWIWWCLIDLWEWIWILAGTTGSDSLAALLMVTPQFWVAICLSGWISTFLTLQAPTIANVDSGAKSIGQRTLWIICGLYSVIFITMNWALYFNLLVPHGDSAMYEEHLWNILHGKGFRSYLDRGLFLGEHIQFVHLFLIPLYAIWPSHLLLEASSTIALALGVYPVFWMTLRHTRSRTAATAVAAAYLLYFPMQFLDIEIDLKTFRPESFGIPLLLLTLDQIDRRNFYGSLIGIAFCLSVKEDYTLIFGPLGLWIALNGKFSIPFRRLDQKFHRRTTIGVGLMLSVLSVVYLWLAMRVVMPWFRSGDEVHYASYFSRFGNSPEEILRTWMTNPGAVASALLTADTAIYAIGLLCPLAFLPLFSPGRLAVGFPLFAILCMNELEGSRTPQHQFHAPLVAIMFWSLAAGLPLAARLFDGFLQRIGWLSTKHAEMQSKAQQNNPKGRDTGSEIPQFSYRTMGILARVVWTSSFATGLFFSLGPLGIPFWDSGSSWYWNKLYSTSPRAVKFAEVINEIPRSARVASTDFVHPRFTHYQRSYDYSDYVRKLNREGQRVPDDTEYIVIDTSHRYSKVKHPGEVPEFRDHPDEWQVLPDQTDGYFIVLKRK